jgi:hypothetical protein
MARYVYKLGEHKVKLLEKQEDGSKRRVYKKLPILSRALEKTGELIGLERATEEDIKTIRRIRVGGEESEGDGQQPPGQGQPGEGEGAEEREIVYYKLGSWRADRIILVYEAEEERNQEGGEQQQPGEGEQGEEQEEEKKKLKRVQVPIPSWAPSYKVMPTLFSKAKAAGLKVVGAYRHGFLIPAPAQGTTGGGGGGGGTTN